MPDATPQTPQTPAEPELAGRELGDFRLLRRLARGAMAEVYLAEQVSLRRQVAVKVLKAALAKDESYVKRFHNEAHAAASLMHANIVQIHSVGCVDGIHFIAQEYVQGQNLREWMVRRGPPDLRLAMTVMRQVAAALQKAAEHGIVHRDVKPENIMLARTGEVKVADFGLARLAAAGGGMDLTQVGITMGTPLYMSPEQVEGRPLDPRSDLYSFGVTCYHMLAGMPPFRGETALAIAVQHLKSQPDRLENLRPDLPPALCRIVHRLLAKEPGERYATARDVLRDLRALEREGEAEHWPDDAEPAAEAGRFHSEGAATQRLAAVMRTSGMRTVSRRRWIAWGAGLAAAFALGGITAWATREPFLLAEHPTPVVPQQKSARDQFLFAQLQSVDRATWLQSVERYFPQDEYFVARAREELARLYLQEERPADALAMFDKLADHQTPEFKAFGLAGQSVVLTQQGNFERAAQVLAKLAPLRDQLDARMSLLVVRALRANRRHMDAQQAAEWDQWQKSLSESEPAEGEPDGGG